MQMKDQATSLRELVHGKTEYGAVRPAPSPDAMQPPPVQPAYPDAGETLYMPVETGGVPVSEAQKKPRFFRPTIRTGARVIAITSGKGGVGKTNLTVNLAIAMTRIGRRVLVIDADLGMANVDVVLGTASKHHLLHLLQPEIGLKDVLIQGPYGIRYISGGSAIERVLEFSPEERKRLMDKLAECEAMADIVLVDTGAGLGQNVLDFILAADEVILVTTPEPTALTDAYAVMKAYNMYASKKDLKIVVNRVYDESESEEVLMKLRRTSEKFLSLPINGLGAIYEDRSVMNAVKRQAPLLEAYPDAMAARCIEAIAKNILYGGQHEVRAGWRGFLKRLLKFQ